MSVPWVEVPGGGSRPSLPRRIRRVFADVTRSQRVTPSLVAGGVVLLALICLGVIGGYTVNRANVIVGALQPLLRPSAHFWLGTDAQGRDIWDLIVLGTPETLKMGLIAGVVGLGVGLVLGLVAGYFGGVPDGVIRLLTDSLLTVPAIAVMVLIAVNVTHMTTTLMAMTVATLAWMVPTRAIRAQVLSIRERSYLEVARANGMRELEILFREVLPNLIPYVAASFVSAVGAAILAAVGLETLGLGANQTITLGTTIYWADSYGAVLAGQWWWWAPPMVAIAIIFIGLYLLSSGLDKFANPRLGNRS